MEILVAVTFSSSGSALILQRKFVANHLTVYKVCNVGAASDCVPLAPTALLSGCPRFLFPPRYGRLVDSITQTTHMAQSASRTHVAG